MKVVSLLLFLGAFIGVGKPQPEDCNKPNYQCAGKHKLPINAFHFDVLGKTFVDLKFRHFDKMPQNAVMTNKGYYIVLDLTYDGAPPLISDGPLKENEVYELDQIRFEWDRTTGVNDTAIRPMEMHILFRNTKKKDFDEASHADNGLAALAFFFAMGNDFYAGYGILAKFLKEIKTPNTSTAVPPMPLIHMMPKAIVSYYHYSGTLLAPPCSSSVIWMDFPTPIDLPLSLAILFNGLYTPHPYTNDKRPATGQLGSVINFVAEVNSVPDGSIAIDDWNGNVKHTLISLPLLLFCIYMLNVYI